MKVHIRYDTQSPLHQDVTVFVNGASCGSLRLRHAESIWLEHILRKGCEALSPKGRTPITFVSSGKPPDVAPEQMDGCVKVL